MTDALLGEHGVFYALFDQIETVASTAANVAQIQSTAAVLNAVLLSHANLEEALLFPALESHMGKSGPLAVMRDEHDQIELALKQIEDVQEVDEGVGCVARALNLARDHFQKEESVLFSMARQLLDDEAQTRLGEAWAEARRVTIA